MASRRRRGRRGWSWSRFKRRLSRQPDSVVSAACGAALLLALWLLWPEHDHGRQNRWQSAERQTTAGAETTGGLPQPSLAFSAKRRLSGDTVALRGRIAQRLPQVAETMPEIGIPQPAVGQMAATDTAPATEADHGGAGLASDRSAQAEERPSSGAGLSVTSAGLELVPATDPIAPTEAAIEPAAPPLVGPAPAGSGPAPAGSDQGATVVARLEAPAALVPPETARQGAPTWLRNAVAVAPDDRPAIAVVIDDLGFSRRAVAALSRLPGPLTLSFLPYAANLDEQTKAARAAGHELMVHVPMEPRGREFPGPNALTSNLTPAELLAHLGSQLSKFDGFVGINNHMGSRLTAEPEPMAVLMAELRRRGLLFLDSRTTPHSVAGNAAARMGVPYAERDVFIDNELNVASVLQELARAERVARSRGHAVVIGHPHEATIEALKTWLPTLEARGIALVPVSAIVARRSCAAGHLLVADTCARYAVAATTAHVQ